MFSLVLKSLKIIHNQLCQSKHLLPTVIKQFNLVEELNASLSNNEPLSLNFKQMKKIFFITKDGRKGMLFKSSKGGDLSEGRIEGKGIGVKPSQYWNRFGENLNVGSGADIAKIIFIELK